MSQIRETLGEELRVAEEEIRAQHELIEGLLRGRSGERVANPQVAAALRIAVVETDSNGVVVWANPAAGALFRVESWQLRGKPLVARVEPADRRALRTALTAAIARVGTQYVSLRVAPLHGRAFPVNMAIIGDADPARAGLAGRAASDAETDEVKAPTVRFLITPEAEADCDAESPLLVALGSVSVLSAFDGDLRSTLTRVATLAVAGITPAVGATLTVGSPAQPALLVSTNGLAQTGDGDQFRVGAGPSWDAYTTNVAVTSATLHADERWPALGRERVEAASGTDAVTAVPLSSGIDAAGVLALYGTSAVADPGVARRATLFADAATALLRQHTAIEEMRTQEAHLRTALSSRPIIDLAKGILMARNGFDADAAFAELVDRSQHTNIKVRELARQLVTEVSGRPSGPPAEQPAPPAAPAQIPHPTGSESLPAHRGPASDDASPMRPPSRCGPTSFHWSQRRGDDAVVVSLAGELDIASVELEPLLLWLAESGHAATIVLDMSELSFIDAYGVGVIVSAWKAAKAHGRVLLVDGLHGLPARVFRLVGLEPMMVRRPFDDISEGELQ